MRGLPHGHGDQQEKLKYPVATDKRKAPESPGLFVYSFLFHTLPTPLPTGCQQVINIFSHSAKELKSHDNSFN
jgi:hypothetical protein